MDVEFGARGGRRVKQHGALQHLVRSQAARRLAEDDVAGRDLFHVDQRPVLAASRVFAGNVVADAVGRSMWCARTSDSACLGSI